MGRNDSKRSKQERGENRMKKIIGIFVFVILVLSLSFIIWQLETEKKLQIAVINKTVPDESYREHLGFNWLLKTLKYVDSNSHSYQLNDYYGFKPDTSNQTYSINDLPKSYAKDDLIYISDTYGVYQNDFPWIEKKREGDRSNLVYGGLTMKEWKAIVNRLNADKKSTLIAEFNTLASPTDETVRNHMSNILGIRWSGWMGRYFDELDYRKNKEIPKWLVDEYRDNWAYKGEGFILINEQKNKIVVLKTGEDIDDKGIWMKFTEEGEKTFNLKKSVKYNYWFDIVTSEDDRNVLANYDWNLTQKGKKKLVDKNIPTSFVAVNKTQVKNATAYYLAGDFNDISAAPNFYQMKGILTINKYVNRFTESAFYWDTYVPMMKTILEQAYEGKTNQKVRVSNSVQTQKEKIQYSARISDDKMEVKVNGQWKNMKVKGVNIGIAKPGYFPGEAAISEDEYYQWFTDIGKLGANTIRVYTIHPPGFYNALKKYNESHKNPIYILHGVWIEEERLISQGNAFDKKGTTNFQKEIKKTIDVIHGNAMILPKGGHASGAYNADISKYVIGWILGIEWDPEMVHSTNKLNKTVKDYNGKYVETKNASPFEHWLAQLMDYTATYELEKYNWIRPLSFTNWVTTDILKHPNEPSEEEDLVSINPNIIHLKEPFTLTKEFASYHIYPYYPESMNYDYQEFVDFRGKKNNYAGYLKDLHKAHKIPILVAEFGVPSSRGMTHTNIYGWNQGHLSEKEQGNILVNLYEDIEHEGLLGGLVFTWQDEWFKRTWNTMDYDNPDRRPYWSNAQTNEQQFGLLSFDRLKIKVDGKYDDWSEAKVLYKDGKKELQSLMMDHDERYIYYKIKMNDLKKGYPMLLLDTLQGKGNTSIKQFPIVHTKNGLEFIAPIKSKKDARILVDHQYDLFAAIYKNYGAGFNYFSKEDTGLFSPIRYVLNDSLTIPTTKKVIPFSYYETGKLKEGNGNPNSKDYNSLVDFNINDKEKTIELRIPWLLLNFKDPSTKEIMGDISDNNSSTREEVDGIQVGLVYVNKQGELLDSFPKIQDKMIPSFKQYSWDHWNSPKTTYRLKESYYILQKAFTSTDE